MTRITPEGRQIRKYNLYPLPKQDGPLWRRAIFVLPTEAAAFAAVLRWRVATHWAWCWPAHLRASRIPRLRKERKKRKQNEERKENKLGKEETNTKDAWGEISNAALVPKVLSNQLLMGRHRAASIAKWPLPSVIRRPDSFRCSPSDLELGFDAGFLVCADKEKHSHRVMRVATRHRRAFVRASAVV